MGFPTETDADFELTVSLVRAVPFKNNFIFKYSPRPGTVAIDRFEDDVPNEVKRLRNNLLLDIQTEVSARVHAAWVGKRVEVLVEDIRDDSDESVAAATQESSPPLVADAASPARKATSMSLPLAGRSSGAPAQPAPLRASRSTSTRPARQAIGRTRGDLIVSIPLERGATAPGRGSILEVDILRSAPLILEGCVVKTVMAASEGRL